MYRSRETLLREEDEAEIAKLRVPLDPELSRPESERKIVTILDSPTGTTNEPITDVSFGDE